MSQRPGNGAFFYAQRARLIRSEVEQSHLFGRWTLAGSESDDRCNRVLESWNEYRAFTDKGSSSKSHLSIRAAEHLPRLLEAGLTENRAVQIALVNKFLPSDSELFQAASLKNTLQD